MKQEWRPTTWGELATLKYGKSLKAGEREPGDVPVYGTNGRVDYHSSALVEGPGVIVGRKGAYRGVEYCNSDFWVIDTAFWLELREKANVDLRWAWHQLKNFDINNLDSGSALPSTSREAFASIPVLLPPLLIQERIADLLASVDDLIENNRRRIDLLEETARLLYREWFVNFRYPGHEDIPLVDSELGPIPEHWRVETLGDLAEVVKDTVDPASIPSGSPLVGLEHLPRRSTTLADWDLATEVGSRRATFQEGDVLFGKIRPYFHKVVEAPFSGYCSTDAVVLRPLRDSDSAQVLAIASCDDFIAHASASANGTKMPRANMDVLMRYAVPRPTESVGQGFEEVAKPLTELAKQLIRTNSRLLEVRDLLLPRLVAGDLDISDLDLRLEAVG